MGESIHRNEEIKETAGVKFRSLEFLRVELTCMANLLLLKMQTLANVQKETFKNAFEWPCFHLYSQLKTSARVQWSPSVYYSLQCPSIHDNVLEFHTITVLREG